MKSILHISNEDRQAAILMSEIKAIHRLPASIADEVAARTMIEYGESGVVSMPITIEEHHIIVSSWRSSG